MKPLKTLNAADASAVPGKAARRTKAVRNNPPRATLRPRGWVS
jgi:hypothetical protein